MLSDSGCIGIDSWVFGKFCIVVVWIFCLSISLDLKNVLMCLIHLSPRLERSKCKRTSRRVAEVKRKRLKTLNAKRKYQHIFEKPTSTTNIYNQKINNTKKQCITQFGYFCDPNEPTWEQAKEQIAQTTQFQYFNQIKNNKYHNLCTYKKPPKNIEKLLGLGLKFCIQTKLPNQEMDFLRFTSDVRKRFLFAGDNNHDDREECPKRLIIKSEWIPDEDNSCEEVETKLNNFISTINRLNKKHLSHVSKSSNLTNLQQNQLK